MMAGLGDLWKVPIKARQWGFDKLGGGDGGGGGQSASDLFAQITRQQWADYMNTFVPLENQLIKYATDPGVVSGAMSKASEGVNDAFDAQEASSARRLRGLGLTLDADEQAAQTKSSGLARSLADVGSQNIVRDLTRERQDSILGNPAPKVPQGGM
jgi:hypothetical protein